MNTTTAPPAGDQDEHRSAGPQYEMRPLITDADRATAAALVDDRARQFAACGITLPHRHIAAYRDAWAEGVGLYEDDAAGEERLLGCLMLHRRHEQHPRIEDEDGPCLGISLFYTAVGLSERYGWLITLWASDFAARAGATRVYAEAPSPASGAATDPLLDYLQSLGWLVTGTGSNRDGELVERLRLNAQERDGLSGLITCAVPLDAPRPAHGIGALR
ncbi:hypothetical protein PZB75_31190 (plasmid) [Streptomyces sp. AM 4-1-1]|uniref:hypothetical protein n=1 Tax=Streptomyces sp. AM 4-1-1 TaxID=3028710 RepID=UPI0023B9F46B|nr:hypothetical protein [Streptomyces sp. AM 4-1-1]WEH37869.1 hypothetical protein PZB75_31190 [Streptomyces sp. AM 4-1-1]